MPQLHRWNVAVTAAGVLLCLFAAWVLLSVRDSIGDAEQLDQSTIWSTQVHESMLTLQTQDPADPVVEVRILELHAAAVDIQRLGGPALHLPASQVESASYAWLQGWSSPDRPELRITLTRSSVNLDSLLLEQMRSLATARGERSHTLQGLSIVSIALAASLMAMLVQLRHRALTAEEVGEHLERALVQVQLTREQEQTASRAKSDFLATVSHEIRTPLNAILGSAELLGADALSAPQAERVAVIRAAGETLLSLIDAVLDLASIESGDFELQPRPFEPLPLLEDTLMIFARDAADKNLALHMWVDPKLPSLTQGDPERLRQVLVNLLSNAVKFTSHGQVLLRVLWTPEGLVLEVIDTGPGIKPEEHARIQETFTQLGTSRHADYGGVGLGLPISLRILDAMGGSLEIHSQPGQGSLFRALAPLTPLAPPTLFEVPGEIVVAGESYAASHAAAQLLSWGADCLLVPHTEGLDLGDVDVLLLDHDLSCPYQPKLLCLRLYGPQHSGPGLTQPIRPRSLLRALTQQAPPPSPESPPPSAGPRVLVVDDHPGNRTVMGDMLAALGAQVRLATGGRQAIQALQDRDIDLVFMDIDMPDMDGLETTRSLRAQGLRIPILGLSGHSSPEARRAGLLAGMDDYLTKPVRLATLRTALARVLKDSD